MIATNNIVDSTKSPVTLNAQHLLEHNMLRKERNRLSDENGRILFRAAQNLRYLMKAKQELKGQINDALATSFDTFVDEVDMTEE